MRPALLILNGPQPPRARVQALARRVSLIVAADGGLGRAIRLGIRPRVVVGDMDSLPKPLPRWPQTAYWCDFDPEASDFEKALRFLRDSGARPVWVTGAFGGRADHQLVNIALAERHGAPLGLTLVDAGSMSVVAGPGRHLLKCRKGETISLLPASPGCRVRARGLRWPLRGERLNRSSRGLSNRAARASVTIEVLSGRLWIVRPGT